MVHDPMPGAEGISILAVERGDSQTGKEGPSMSEPIPDGVTLTQEEWDLWVARQRYWQNVVEEEEE
jgi:hypothetical protein